MLRRSTATLAVLIVTVVAGCDLQRDPVAAKPDGSQVRVQGNRLVSGSIAMQLEQGANGSQLGIVTSTTADGRTVLKALVERSGNQVVVTTNRRGGLHETVFSAEGKVLSRRTLGLARYSHGPCGIAWAAPGEKTTANPAVNDCRPTASEIVLFKPKGGVGTMTEVIPCGDPNADPANCEELGGDEIVECCKSEREALDDAVEDREFYMFLAVVACGGAITSGGILTAACAAAVASVAYADHKVDLWWQRYSACKSQYISNPRCTFRY